MVRQALSLYAITYVGKRLCDLVSPSLRLTRARRAGIFVLYFSVATFSYYYIFDHRSEPSAQRHR